jgi:hypothetical protein
MRRGAVKSIFADIHPGFNKNRLTKQNRDKTATRPLH